MIPLLATGVLSLAGNAIDNWNTAGANAKAAAAAKAQAAQQAQFDPLLLQANALLASQPSGPQANLQTSAVISSIAGRLLQAPQVQGALANRGMRQANLGIAADGSVTMKLAGGFSEGLVLDPATQSLASDLHSLLLLRGQTGSTLQAVPPSTFQSQGFNSRVVLSAS